MKNKLTDYLSISSSIITIVVGVIAVIHDMAIGIALFSIGIIITAGILIYRYKFQESLYQLKILDHEVTIDLKDDQGDLAHHSRKTKFKCLKDEVTDFTDHMSADGEFTKIEVEPGSIEDIRREGGDLFIRSNFGKVLYKDEIITKIIKANLIKSFKNKPEYWSVRIIVPTEEFTLKIIFDKNRPYKSFKGLRRITTYEILSKIQPIETIIQGRPALVWNVQEPNIKDVYKLQWDW